MAVTWLEYRRIMARILVIEDEPDIQQILDYNLREKGHKVFIAGKGEVCSTASACAASSCRYWIRSHQALSGP